MEAIRATAEYFTSNDCETKSIIITKEGENIFIDGSKAMIVLFNDIQLRLRIKHMSYDYILIDGRTDSGLTIKKMHEMLTEVA